VSGDEPVMATVCPATASWPSIAAHAGSEDGVMVNPTFTGRLPFMSHLPSVGVSESEGQQEGVVVSQQSITIRMGVAGQVKSLPDTLNAAVYSNPHSYVFHTSSVSVTAELPGVYVTGGDIVPSSKSHRAVSGGQGFGGMTRVATSFTARSGPGRSRSRPPPAPATDT